MTGTSDIKVVDNSGYTPTIIPEFVLLGMLDDYVGRVDRGPSIVEVFYPKERRVAELFAHHASSMLKGKGPELRQTSTGHVEVISESLKARLDGHYVRGASNRYMTLHATAFPLITSRQFIPSEMDPRFSYLYGSHLRYSDGDAPGFVFANAATRLELLISFLSDARVSWVSHKFTVNTAPVRHEIRFEPDPVLADFLSRATSEKRAGYAGES